MATLSTSWTTLKEATVLTDSYGETLKLRLSAKRGDIDYTNKKVSVTYRAKAIYSGAYISDASGKLYVSGTSASQKSKSATTIDGSIYVDATGTISYGSDGAASGSATARLDFPNWGKDKSITASFSLPSIKQYTVTYNANGGSGAPAQDTKWYNVNLTLSKTVPTKEGYTFQGWATSQNGSVAYTAGGTYKSNADVTLYAVWGANTWSVVYNENAGEDAVSNMPDGSQTKTYGETLILSGNVPTRTRYNFLGWATSPDGEAVYSAGGEYTDDSSVTLYAVWELAASRVTVYDADGNAHTALCHIYDSSGNVHYGIITVYDELGNAHVVV